MPRHAPGQSRHADATEQLLQHDGVAEEMIETRVTCNVPGSQRHSCQQQHADVVGLAAERALGQLRRQLLQCGFVPVTRS